MMRPQVLSALVITVLFLLTDLHAQTRNYADHVVIARDEWGVPHIKGDTDADVAYGLAWANAEDDLKTMQDFLILIKGLNGRVKGKEGAVTDFFVKAVAVTELVEAKYETDLSDDMKRYIDGYVAGLNDYVASHKKEVRMKRIFPVTPHDIVKGYVLAMTLISGAQDPVGDIVDGKLDDMNAKGSNAFAFSGNKTTNGNSILCSNPHMPFEGLFSWYEAHLVSDEGLNVMGALFPGGISIFLGTNQNLGWTHTWNGGDLVDVFHLEMNPDNKLQYKFDGEWVDLEKDKAKLKVKLAKALPVIGVKRDIYFSKYGPTFQSKNGEFYSVRYGAGMDIRVIEQVYRFNKAKNLEEYRAALDMQSMARFNVVYADKDGHIFYLDNGMVPVRDRAYDWKNAVPGNTSKTLWTEFYPIDSLPMVTDPNCGYVYNTNNTPYDATAPEENIEPGAIPEIMGFRMGNNNRSRRFQELMVQHEKVDFDLTRKIKFDSQYPDSSGFLVSVIGALEALEFEGNEDLEPLAKKMLSWDRVADGASEEGAMFLLVVNYVFDKKGLDDHAFFGPIEVEKPLMIEALRNAKDHMVKYFGTLNVALKDLQRMRRENGVDVPMPGFADALAANYAKPAEDGRYVGFVGDSYTLIAEYDSTGVVRLETLATYGASTDPESPHYSDQLTELWQYQKTKPMTLDWEQVKKDAERIYAPVAE